MTTGLEICTEMTGYLRRPFHDVDPCHEVVQWFAMSGMPLSSTLAGMLNELPEHRSERRGCGFTQATRLLADVIREPVTGHAGLRALFALPVEDMGTAWVLGRCKRMLEEIDTQSLGFESVLLGRMILSCVLRNGQAPRLALASAHKLDIGTCPLAEEYFLEIAYSRVRRGGSVNIVIDRHRQPVLVEKCGLGENFSCISVAPFNINGVDIPAGSLIGIERDAPVLNHLGATRSRRGVVLGSDAIRSVCFLRLTTLSVPPLYRKRAFSSHFDQQVRGGLFTPGQTTIRQLWEYAVGEVA